MADFYHSLRLSLIKIKNLKFSASKNVIEQFKFWRYLAMVLSIYWCVVCSSHVPTKYKGPQLRVRRIV